LKKTCLSLWSGVVVGSIEGVSVNVKFTATNRVASLPWGDVQVTEPKSVPIAMGQQRQNVVVASSPPPQPASRQQPVASPRRPTEPVPFVASSPPTKQASTWSSVRPVASERAPPPSIQPTVAPAVAPVSPRGHASTFSASRPPPPGLDAPVLPGSSGGSSAMMSSSPPPSETGEKKRGLTLMGGMRSPRNQPTPAPRVVEIGAPTSPRKESNAPQPMTRNQCPQCFASFPSKEDLVRHLDRDCRKGSAPARAPAVEQVEPPKPMVRKTSNPPIVARQPPASSPPPVQVPPIQLQQQQQHHHLPPQSPPQQTFASQKPAKPLKSPISPKLPPPGLRFDPDIPLRGWMNMKSSKGLVKSWKAFWFDQEGTLLHYSKGENDASVGWIDLNDISSVDVASNVIRVTASGQTYALKNDDLEKHLYWTEGFQHYRNAAKDSGVASLRLYAAGDDDSMSFLDLLAQESPAAQEDLSKESPRPGFLMKLASPSSSPRVAKSPISPKASSKAAEVMPVMQRMSMHDAEVSDVPSEYEFDVSTKGSHESGKRMLGKLLEGGSRPVSFDFAEEEDSSMSRPTSSLEDMSSAAGPPLKKVPTLTIAASPKASGSKASPPPRKALPLPDPESGDDGGEDLERGNDWDVTMRVSESLFPKPQELLEVSPAEKVVDLNYSETPLVSAIEDEMNAAPAEEDDGDDTQEMDQPPEEQHPEEEEDELRSGGEEEEEEDGSSSWEAPSEEWANDEQYLEEPVAAEVEKPKANKWGGVNVMGFAPPTSAVKLKAVSRSSARRSKRQSKRQSVKQAALPKGFDPKAALGNLKKVKTPEQRAMEEAAKKEEEERRLQIEKAEREEQERKQKEIEDLALALLKEQEQEEKAKLEEEQRIQEEERLRVEEEGRLRLQAEERLRLEEEERLRLEEEERLRLEEEERLRLEEEERLRLEEEERLRLEEEERLRLEEEERLRVEVEQRSVVDSASEAIICPVCGSSNDSSAVYCCECGSSDGFQKTPRSLVPVKLEKEVLKKVEPPNKKEVSLLIFVFPLFSNNGRSHKRSLLSPISQHLQTMTV
jgi:hypothetical protein